VTAAGRLGAALALALVALLPTGAAQDVLRVELEARLAPEVPLNDAGVDAVELDAGATARVAFGVEVADALTLAMEAAPTVTRDPATDGAAVRHGLQEATVALEGGAWRVRAGLQRRPLGELRLAPAVTLDVPLASGDPRGAWGVRVRGYVGDARIRAGVAWPAGAGNDLTPTGAGGGAVPGGGVSVRIDGEATLEAHLLRGSAVDGAGRTARLAAGATASTTVGGQVVYGEAWVLQAPAAVRGGAGVSGYAGAWLWTAETHVAPPGGGLARTPAPADGSVDGFVDGSRPAVRASASRAVGARGRLEAAAGVAWPRIEGARAARWDAGASWTRPSGDADLVLDAGLRGGPDGRTLRTGLTLRTAF
jgi:hypothetical protein